MNHNFWFCAEFCPCTLYNMYQTYNVQMLRAPSPVYEVVVVPSERVL